MSASGARLVRAAYFGWPALASAGLAARDAWLLTRDLVRAHGSLARAGWRGLARCERCGLDARIPGVALDARGVCHECTTNPGPRTPRRPRCGASGLSLERVADPEARRALTPRADGGVDALVALSGGKDSLLTLVGAAELGLRTRALALDNGFLLARALADARSWCARLGVPLTVRHEPMHEVVHAALGRTRLVPWPCIACFDRLSRLLVDEAAGSGAPTILTGLRYRWPSQRPIAPAREAFAAFGVDRRAAGVSVLNLPAAFELTEEEERALLARFDWVDPGLAGHSTNCLLPARFERLHLERLGRPHESVRFVALEAREGVIPRSAAIQRMSGAPLTEEHAAELARRLAEGMPT